MDNDSSPTPRRRPAASIRELVERLIIEHACGGVSARTKAELGEALNLIAREVYQNPRGFHWSPYHETQLSKLARATNEDSGRTAWQMRTNEPPGPDETEPVYVIAGPASPYGIYAEPFDTRPTAKYRQVVRDHRL